MKLSVSHLNFRYSEDTPVILEDFSFEALSGEVVTLKGASGSGKSTFFRLLLGFEKTDSGRMSFDKKSLEGEGSIPFRNKVALLPQDLDMGEGSLKEVFYFPFSFKNNQAKKPTQPQAESVFQSLGLQKIPWKEDFKSLSTGQRQRIGIAICHFLDKDILLLDEPTSALDQSSKQKIKELLFRKNKIIISASHDDWWINHSTKIVTLNTTSNGDY